MTMFVLKLLSSEPGPGEPEFANDNVCVETDVLTLKIAIIGKVC
ncbi:hypothetical protein CFF8240_0667 [Campylobacter fetus subsp. fetus 82-40]|uniref:Uncharacterized protein n=1 Tax=Campylobacter fetus subsp. fetus (strain 82-40) TaxID=360106 RepID=A0RNQ9_CAMFF|nr:hypothetical protein CFF8240_0667 [Campylobacter fetus subsp. fetus 82-40]